MEIEFNGKTYRQYRTKGRPGRYFHEVNKRTLLHRDIWIKAYGPIPDGMHIHHIDGDWLNNDISNLECLTPKEHGERHAGERTKENRKILSEFARPAASKWHGSIAGLAFHSKIGKKSWVDRQPIHSVVCANCGIQVQTFFNRSGKSGDRFCSQKCHRAKADREGKYLSERICGICGSLFKTNKYRESKTCSRLCGAHLRKRNRASL